MNTDAHEQAPRTDQEHWFAEEVHPHGSSLKAYLRGAFPTVRDVDDVVQESYLRILKARAGHPIQCARAFLFGIARRLAVDAIRKDIRTKSHESVMEFSSLDVLDRKADVAEAVSLGQELGLLADAIHSLPARCREIMIMRKLERLSHQEIAEKLGISIPTVEVQISRGMEKCAKYLRSRGVTVRPRQRAVHE